MTAYEWNSRYPVGTPVRYWPSIHLRDNFRDRITTRPARKSATGHAVVSLKDEPGSKSIDFLEVLAAIEVSP